ncbi:MAG: ribosome maturation factor RimP [Gemmatimonadetes bacterium]|nr:ribosome maturation factor RimP [Gemmatimonadota bacterium]
MSAVDKFALKADIVAFVEPIVREHGAELVDIELSGVRGNQLVRLLVHKNCGVTLATCESISREVADLFDIEDPIAGRYRLEVTSPGLDRPLETDGDFTRAQGRLLKVVLTSGQAVKGRLVAWEADQIQLDSPAEIVARADITKANIEPEL